MTLHAVAFFIACLACAAYGSKSHLAGSQVPSISYEWQKKLEEMDDVSHSAHDLARSQQAESSKRSGIADLCKSLAILLLSFNNPATGWQASLPSNTHTINYPRISSSRLHSQLLMTGSVERFGELGVPRSSDSTPRYAGLLRKRKEAGFSRRSVLSTLIAGGLTTVAVPVLKAEAVSVSTGMQVFKIAKATLDPRLYRGLILANGVRVLLASDPTLIKAAAAMNVEVGWMTDPKEFPGLAHFCEHMLFLGSKKFPNEEGFEKTVAKGGGTNNAFTTNEETNFFFNVQAPALQPVLERFAGFFTSPLFTESAATREVNAVNSEHLKNVPSDFWRYRQLLKMRADPSHPYNKFSTGNKETLRNGDADTRAALLKFHNRYYQADRMSLALIGPQPLDKLQELVMSNFASINSTSPPLPGASEAYDSLPPPFEPAKAPAEAYLQVPVRNGSTLKLSWCMLVTDLDNWVKSRPQEIWTLLMSNRGKGGLLPGLKRRGLALGMGAQVDELTRSFILLEINIALTPLGLTKWREVAALVSAYMRSMRDAGPPKRLAQEDQAIKKVAFEYREPLDPSQFVNGGSASLPFYSPEQWVKGPSLSEDGAELGAQYMLEQCSEPANTLVTLVTNESIEVQAKFTEPIYGTRYGKIPIAREIDMWRNAEIPGDFSPPEPNPFIPTDFSIKCASGGRKCVAPQSKEKVMPKVLEDSLGVRVHFLQDSIFKRPKAFGFFLFRSPLLMASPKASITSSLFQSSFADVLQESTYQAALAGLGAGISSGNNGIVLTAFGYNSRLPELATYVSQQVKSAELTQDVFNRQLYGLRQGLTNSKLNSPLSLCGYYRGLALETPEFSIEELESAVESTTLSDVLDFQKSLLPESLLEAFLAGNLEEAEARQMVESVRKAIPSSAPLSPDDVRFRRVRVLQPGQRVLRQFKAYNPDETNFGTEVYLQIGLDEGSNWVLLALLVQLLQQPFFTEMRTKQQLGYIVSCGISDAERVRAITFNVQSSALPPPQVEERIDTFLTNFRAELAAFNESELKEYKDNLAARIIDVDKRLPQQVQRLWGEIIQRRYEYDRPWRTAERMRKVTKEQLLSFYDRFVLPGSPESRRLATHIFAPKGAPAELVVEPVPDEFYPRPPDRPLPGVAAKSVAAKGLAAKGNAAR